MPIQTQLKGGRPIRAVLFDLDNTLYNRDLAFERWARSFSEDHFAGDGADRQAEVLAQMVIWDDKGYRPKPAMFADVKALYPTLPYDIDALCALFYAQWTAYMALDAGTVHLLEALDTGGIPFGIVTNGSVQQYLKIDRLGLRSRTACLFISEVFGSRKPDAAIFHAAASALNVPCEDCLFVGDNPDLDICGAHAVGMTTAWLHRGTSWPASITGLKPDFSIDSLAELLKILPPT